MDVLPPEIIEQLSTDIEGGECQPGSYEPVPGDCTSYMSCSRDGKKQLQQCQAGLHWIQTKLACDWKDLSDCDELIEPLKIYGECKEGEYTPKPGDCGKYRRCVHKKYQEFSCQAGTHWNNLGKYCDHPQNAGCLGGASSVSTGPVNRYEYPINYTKHTMNRIAFMPLIS